MVTSVPSNFASQGPSVSCKDKTSLRLFQPPPSSLVALLSLAMLWASLFFTASLSLGLVNSSPLEKCSKAHKLKTTRARPTLREVKDSFKKANIVPDLLPVFKPSSLLYLSYPQSSLKKKNKNKDKESKTVLPGSKFPKDGTLFHWPHTLRISPYPITATETAPEISIEGPGWPGAYVFFLLDPDAPSHSNPKWSQVRHMFMGNLSIAGFSKHVPGSVVLANETSAVNEYMPPVSLFSFQVVWV
jgi:hypothetical protein